MNKEIQKNTPSKINVHKNHRQRLRAELRKIDFDTLEDYKLVELLLFQVFKRVDTNPIAHNLINTFGNLANLLEARYEQLITVPGVGDSTATFLTLLLPLLERYTTQKAMLKQKITTTQDYVKYYGEIIKYSSKEYFAVIPLNNRYEGNKFVKMEVGINDQVDVKFNHVYNTMRDSEFNKVILMHNHPSGNPNPSPKDFETTELIAFRLKVLNIEVVDSIIVSVNGFYSFKDQGIMDKIAEKFRLFP